MFKDPNKHLKYLKSEQFAMDILTLGSRVRPVLEDEPRCIFLQSPCYGERNALTTRMLLELLLTLAPLLQSSGTSTGTSRTFTSSLTTYGASA